MNCKKCGKELNEGDLFCSGCGTKVVTEETSEKTEEKPSGAEMVKKITENVTNSEVVKNIQNITDKEISEIKDKVKDTVKDKKKVNLILSWAAGVVATILVFVIFVASMPKADAGIDEKYAKISPKAVSIIGDTLFNRKGKTKSVGEVPVYVYRNMDKSMIAYVLKDDDENQLWYSDADLKPVKIDTAGIISECFISDDGRYIAYVTQDSPTSTIRNPDGTIYIYDVRSKEKEKIASDVVPYSVVASPDCKTVSYMTNYEQINDNDMYIGGIGLEKQKIAKDGCYAVAVTNKAKKVIYFDAIEEKLYYYNGKESDKITSSVDIRMVLVNSSEDEVLFARKGKTYLYKAGSEEPVKLCARDCDIALCDGISWGTPSRRLCMENFSGLVFSDEEKNELLVISENEDNADELAQDCRSYICSYDGKRVLYVDDDGLHIVSVTDEPKDELIYDEEGIGHIVVSGDFSKIYVVNDDDELIYVTSNGKHEKVSSDIDVNKVAVSDLSGKVYFLEDGDMYEADRTKSSKKKLKSDVVEIMAEIMGIVYVNDSDKVGLIFG